MDNKVVAFENKNIRRVWHNEQWFFSIVDVIEVLTETDRARKYWSDLKKKLITEGYNEVSEKIGQLKMIASDGKNRLTDVANTEGMLRIIMSVPSPKAEPLKVWMAQVGKERLEEAENPELGIARSLEYYKEKGYSEEWIQTRLKGIEIRKELTNEWKNRGVKEGQEYSILTSVIAKGTFGLSPNEHKKLKSLDKPSHELRDHMTNLELVLTALGEEVTRTIAIDRDAQGFEENHEAAVKGGQAAGESRERVEAITGKKVVSSENHLKQLKKGSEDISE